MTNMHVPEPTCRTCGYSLRGLSVDGSSPECQCAIARSFADRTSRRWSAAFLLAALLYPLVMSLIAWLSDPMLLLGASAPTIACVLAPATILGVAFAASVAGIRFNSWTIIAVFLSVTLTASVTYWHWQAILWGI